MRQNLFVVVVAIVATATTACVRSSVTQLTQDSATITARGSAFNDLGDVQKEMLTDAANLTLKSGYDYFTITNAAGGYATSYVTTPGVTQTQSNFNAFVTPYYVNGTASTYSYSTPTVTNTVEKPRGAISIRMFHGSTPANDPNSFDARGVLQFAGGAVPQASSPPSAPVAASSASGTGQYPSLQSAIQAHIEAALPASYTDADRSQVGSCMAFAIVDGIPPSDQETMLAAYNSGQVSPESDDLFVKWMGVSFIHGPVVKPDVNKPATYEGGNLHYQDGTVVLDADPSQGKRLKANLERICPDVVARHPEIMS